MIRLILYLSLAAVNICEVISFGKTMTGFFRGCKLLRAARGSCSELTAAYVYTRVIYNYHGQNYSHLLLCAKITLKTSWYNTEEGKHETPLEV